MIHLFPNQKVVGVGKLVSGIYWSKKSRALCIQLRLHLWFFCPTENKSYVLEPPRDMFDTLPFQ